MFLIIGIPIILLPSTLVLAFPIENPAQNRSAGAIAFVFIVAAFGVVALLDFWRERWPSVNARWAGGIVAAGLFVGLLGQNFDLALVQYPAQYKLAVPNASEIGEFVHDFAHTIGSYPNAYVVPYPYWVDTRLVGMYAGDPERDYAVLPDVLPTLNTLLPLALIGCKMTPPGFDPVQVPYVMFSVPLTNVIV